MRHSATLKADAESTARWYSFGSGASLKSCFR